VDSSFAQRLCTVAHGRSVLPESERSHGVRRLTLIVAGAMVAAGCGHSSRRTEPTSPSTAQPPPATSAQAPATTTAPTSTTPGKTILVRVYLLRKIGAVARNVPATAAIGSAALRALSAGPSSGERSQGWTSAVPSNSVSNLRITNGVATIDLDSDLSHEALAQVVYTLTQFPTIAEVRPSRTIPGTKPFTRTNFEDVTPAILIESPLPGQAVTSPLDVRGTANTFEATFDLEVRNSSGVRVAWRFVTATSGSGRRGTFDTTISFPATGGPLTLVGYEPSAADGRPIHAVRVPLEGS
jgi:germination protein M